MTKTSSFLTIMDFVDIKAGTTEAECAASEPTASLLEDTNLLATSISDLPSVGPAAASFSDFVEDLITLFVTLFSVSNSVSSWAAACRKREAQNLLDLLADGVIVNDDDLLVLSECLEILGVSLIRLECSSLGVDSTRRHVCLNHFHFF